MLAMIQLIRLSANGGPNITFVGSFSNPPHALEFLYMTQ